MGQKGSGSACLVHEFDDGLRVISAISALAAKKAFDASRITLWGWREEPQILRKFDTYLRRFPPSHSAMTDGFVIVKYEIKSIRNPDGTIHLEARAAV